MTFGLPNWLKSRYKELTYEVPVWYPAHDHPDRREWLVTNGTGGFSSSTIVDAHTRSYHGVLVSAVNEPVGRHIILSQVQEQVSIDGTDYDLSTNYWASGVVAPTGYRYLESFTILPVPTWVFNLDGNYLIKQQALARESNQVHIGYFWLPDRERASGSASLTIKFITAFRDFHSQVSGSAQKYYDQSVSGNQALVALCGCHVNLHLSWTAGVYEPRSQWWWGYHWPEEASRGTSDQEDRLLIGQLRTILSNAEPLEISAALGAETNPSLMPAVQANLNYQKQILRTAALPRSIETDLMILAADQFLVHRKTSQVDGTSIIAGYPWRNDSGRETMISLPGLALACRRFEDARKAIKLHSTLVKDGVMPSAFLDTRPEPEYRAVDPTLWWAWSLYHFYRCTKDKEFLREQYDCLRKAALFYIQGTSDRIQVDPGDGLLRCGNPHDEMTWMDALVEGIPITPRSGKPVEIAALWHNMLGTLCYFAGELDEDAEPFKDLFELSKKSMQKFWNAGRRCLYDLIEPLYRQSEKPDDSVRPNQLFAVSLPFRALSHQQERSILEVVELELLTPLGVRTLSPLDPAYQGRYGCGFSIADPYHRDLSFYQGSVWPWLIGAYCDALVNVNGEDPDVFARILALLHPLQQHLVEEGCVGSISEVFDGNEPRSAHGCFAHSLAVAEVMRVMARALKSI